MSFTPFAPPLQNVATLGTAGYAKINGTGNVLTWTAPSDGAVHHFIVICSETVTSNETGGAISLNITAPGGGTQTGAGNIFAAAKTVGTYHQLDGAEVQAGSTVALVQSSALSAGASTVWATIWAA